MKPGHRLRKWWIGGLLALCVVAIAVRTVRQGRLNRSLVAAVVKGDVAGATEALSGGADPNAREIYENTPRNPIQVIEWALRKDNIVWHDAPVLNAACQSSKPLPLAKILLERGADPNGRSKLGYTALIDCIEQDKSELIRLLVEHGANVNAQNPRGDTAAMLLAGNQFATVRSLPILIAHGAKLNLRNREGKTALQLARESKHSPAIGILLAAGAKE